jgi:hypothetical protein
MKVCARERSSVLRGRFKGHKIGNKKVAKKTRKVDKEIFGIKKKYSTGVFEIWSELREMVGLSKIEISS